MQQNEHSQQIQTAFAAIEGLITSPEAQPERRIGFPTSQGTAGARMTDQAFPERLVSQAAMSIPPVDSGDLSSTAKQKQLIQLVVDSVSSEHSKRAYRIGLVHFFRWWKEQRTADPFARTLIQSYRSHLEQVGSSPATINQRLAPLRKLAEEAASVLLLPAAVAATIRQRGGSVSG